MRSSGERGNGADQALDLTQGVFARLLEKGNFAASEPGKGRFRASLRTDCQHYLIDQFRRRTARGGGIPTVSIDAGGAEERYREILEEQIAATLDDTSEMEDEIRYPFAAITS